jgi:hypothetical protein
MWIGLIRRPVGHDGKRRESHKWDFVRYGSHGGRGYGLMQRIRVIGWIDEEDFSDTRWSLISFSFSFLAVGFELGCLRRIVSY